MKDKNVRTGKLLSRIGGIICLAIAGVMLIRLEHGIKFIPLSPHGTSAGIKSIPLT
ncbi:hypothetical protein J8TS2_18300 [Lederbergia ruris]|uniref:Uncharacterized protein n=1 Tax=Lederbergia ruris TaxID=217495 RepID=A0ABQ4KJ77_9BACI|nr:hypothetical protein J8TS2_18300 [Lederbergia ruris]